jgi:hypothetical protein
VFGLLTLQVVTVHGGQVRGTGERQPPCNLDATDATLAASDGLPNRLSLAGKLSPTRKPTNPLFDHPEVAALERLRARPH